MNFQFDHLVHFMNDPNRAIDTLAGEGIYAVVGGKHGNRPTYNVLTYFDLSYIEIIGTSDKAALEKLNHPPHSMINTIIDSGYTEGFKRFVIRTENIAAAAEHFKGKGLTVTGPVPLSRKRPDGTLLEWQLLFIGKEGDEIQLPYVIEWQETDEERRAELTENSVIKEHESGAAFSHVHFAVRDLAKVIRDWGEWLALPEVGESYHDEDLGANCRTLALPGGNLVFCEPTGDGPVEEVLATHGEKPFQVNFTGEVQKEFTMHGGRYRIDK